MIKLCLDLRPAARSGALPAALMLAACGGTPPPAIGMIDARPNVTEGQAMFAAPQVEAYHLRPADILSIKVFREPDLSVENIPVSADGQIFVPLIGQIRAEGLTARELSKQIEDQLARGYLVDPQASVNVVKYDSHLVTVEGGVENPGVYGFVPGAQLSSAVALAGGPDRTAKLSQLVVFRKTREGTAVAKFDYQAMQTGAMFDPVLMPGDRVIMGTNGLSKFWQDVIQSLPVFSVFTNI